MISQDISLLRGDVLPMALIVLIIKALRKNNPLVNSYVNTK